MGASRNRVSLEERLCRLRWRFKQTMNLNIVVLPGDGVGPEVTEQAVRVLREIASTHGHNFHFEEHEAGGEAITRTGSPIPRTTLDACLAADAVLSGAIGSPEFDHLPSAQKPEAGLLLLRRTLGGFANLWPVSFHKGLACWSRLTEEVG